MKNLHFCTKELIRRIKYSGNKKSVIIKTYRTGFIPELFAGDLINLNERKDGKDELMKQGKIIAVIPIQYRDIGLRGKKEIYDSYNGRRFHPDHWFFEIIIRKWSINHFKIYEDTGYLDKFIESTKEVEN